MMMNINLKNVRLWNYTELIDMSRISRIKVAKGKTCKENNAFCGGQEIFKFVFVFNRYFVMISDFRLIWQLFDIV